MFIDIPEHDGYQIDEDGRIRSKHGRILKSWVCPVRGYGQVRLKVNGKEFNRRVHCLVALAFIGPKLEGMCALHNDGDKLHNHRSNIRYGTHTENMRDRAKHGTGNIGDRHPRAKINENIVFEIRKMRADGFKNVEISKRFGISREIVSHVLNGETWTHI